MIVIYNDLTYNTVHTLICLGIGENCVDIVSDLVENYLDLKASSFVILRAHRLGRVFRPLAPHLGPDQNPDPDISWCSSANFSKLTILWRMLIS